jgi:NhaP-type Na+/H+ or K+/H+ antiporter
MVDDRYQHWVYRHPVKAAALAGVVATQVGTIWGYYGRGIGLPQLPFPAYNGLLFSPASVAKDFSNFGNVSSWFLGQSIHFVNGIVFAILFAITAHHKLPAWGSKARSVQKGLIFGTIQTIVSLGFLFPYVYAPKSGFGFFSFGNNSFGNNPDHWKLPVAVLLWHWIYGALLGLLYNPKKPVAD